MERRRPMKFCPLHYVVLVYKTAKFHWNRFTNDFSSTPQHWRLGCPFFFRFVPWKIWQITIVDRFGRVIHQNACFGARKCLLGFTKIQISVFTPKIPQNPQFLVLPMHFLWKTKILITFQPLNAEQSNFTSLIHCINTTIVRYRKIEFRNPRWPTAPFWIFKILLKFEYL